MTTPDLILAARRSGLRSAKRIVTAMLSGACLSGITGLGSSAQAQTPTWPTKLVRIVVGAPAGTAPDIAARILAEKLSASWGQPVQVDNRPGASGMIAMDNVRGSPADGYTLMFAHAGAVVITPRVLKAAKYDPIGEFTAVAIVADTPFIIVTAAENPKGSVADMIAAAKSDPGGVGVGSTEQATLPSMVANLISEQAGVKFNLVPFNQPNMGIQTLVKGDIKYYIDAIAPVLPQITAGRLKPVALTADRPLPGLQNIPLLKDSLPGFVAAGWFAMIGPKGLSNEISTRINRDINQALANTDLVTRYQTLSMFPSPKTPAESSAFVKTEAERWATVITKLGITPQ
jgi:tripartite-type tricarboxylate transporter receptor subunit TctC